jgi:DNA polymerase-3 subunit alpha
MTKPFASLHVHTQHSPMDSIASSADYRKRGEELGYTAVANTDHGKDSNHREHQLAFAGSDIKPILGTEMYFSVTDRFDKRAKAKRSDGTSVYNHLIVLAKNENGLKNLNRLNEIGWNEGFYSKPRIDREILERYNEDLIVTSACMSGPVAQALLNNQEEQAYGRAQWFKEVFGDRFYIEVMTENSPELNNDLLMLADTLGIAPVLTEDTHYVWPEELWIEEAFLISATKPKQIKGRTYGNFKAPKSVSHGEKMIALYNHLYGSRAELEAEGKSRMEFQDFNLYMAGREFREAEMSKQGIDRADIFDNTVAIADRIEEYPFYKNLNLLPKPKASDPMKTLREKVKAGAKKRGTWGSPEHDAQRERELKIIEDKGKANYFVMANNMAAWAEKENIFQGFGRGSAPGFLTCYELGMTGFDPLPWNLVPERFMDPERNDNPDWDWDISDRRKPEVFRYLQRQHKNVSAIATFNTYKVKNSLKDAASILCIPFKEANDAIEGMPDINATWEHYLESDQGKAFHAKYPEVYELARKFEGRIKNSGMHPAGVVITNEPASNYFPIESAADKDSDSGERKPLIAYDMSIVEEMGGIKYDLLGLKTLSVCEDAVNAIYDRTGVLLKMKDIPLDDPDVFEMLSSGKTKGIFQAEGHAFTNWIKQTGVTSFNDIVIGTSIARPGPMNTVGPIYKRRLAGEEVVSYVHPVMEKRLEETLGCIVYQEQVMFTMTDLAGMSMGKANEVRRVVSKKKDPALLEKYRDEFLSGAIQKISLDAAERLWHDIEAHAGYSFNKAHAVAYSMLTNATAWLKYHYPLEYMYALIKNEKDSGKITEYIIEAKSLGVKILLPHVNKSAAAMSIEDDAIRMGLSNIKFISDKLAERLIALRPIENYKQLEDAVFTKGGGLNSRVLQALNTVGAAEFKDNPKTGKEKSNYFEYLGIPASMTGDLPEKITSQLTQAQAYDENEPAIVLGMVKDIRKGAGWSIVELLDATGTMSFFTGEDSPLQKGQMYLCLIAEKRLHRHLPVDEVKPTNAHELISWLKFQAPVCDDGEAFILAFSGRVTKSKKRMATIVYGLKGKEILTCTVWPSDYPRAFSSCKPGTIVKLQTTLNESGDRFFAGVR